MATTISTSTSVPAPEWNYTAPGAAPTWNYTAPGEAPSWNYTPEFTDPELEKITYGEYPQVDWAQYNKQAGKDLEAYYSAMSNNAVQGLYDRGMAATTVAPSIRMGVGRERTDAWNRYKQSLLDTQLGYETKWWEDENAWRTSENALAGQMATSKWSLENQAALAQQSYNMQGYISYNDWLQQAQLANNQYSLDAYTAYNDYVQAAQLAQNQYNAQIYGTQQSAATSAAQTQYDYYNTQVQAQTAANAQQAGLDQAYLSQGFVPSTTSSFGYEPIPLSGTSAYNNAYGYPSTYGTPSYGPNQTYF